MTLEFYFVLRCHGSGNVLSHCHGLLGHLNATRHSFLVTCGFPTTANQMSAVEKVNI